MITKENILKEFRAGMKPDDLVTVLNDALAQYNQEKEREEEKRAEVKAILRQIDDFGAKYLGFRKDPEDKLENTVDEILELIDELQKIMKPEETEKKVKDDDDVLAAFLAALK